MRTAVSRYPLLHQQPFFTERRMLDDDFPWQPVGWNPAEIDFAGDYTEAEKLDEVLVALPGFPAGDFDLVDQYAEGFEKVHRALSAK